MDVVFMGCSFIFSVLLIILFKRMRCSRRQQNNSCSTVVSMEDKLSQLPDEVIVSILSQMTIREAVLTSSLSIQWQYLWMHVTRLKFDVSQFITWKMFYYPRLCRKEGMKHINLINNRVIDKCLNFVSSKKKVEIFQLDLSLSKNEDRRYTFPFKLITSFRLNLSPFVSLKVLAFNNIDVDNRVVNFFIFNCLLLEKLSIHESRLLTRVEIVGPSCFNLKDLELCHCIGWKSNLLLKNVTSVLTIDFKMSRALICELVHTFTTYFTLLTTLSLEFGHTSMDLHFLDHALPKFNNLKVLVLKVVGVKDESLLAITPLIEASPCLQNLHIELAWHETTISKNRIIRKNCPHQHLKERSSSTTTTRKNSQTSQASDPLGVVGFLIRVKLLCEFLNYKPNVELIFIVSSKVLAKALNSLFNDDKYNATSEDRQLVEDCTSIKRGQFPFKYLNCPKLIQGKEKSTMQSLFNEGITSVLLSVPIHVLSVIVPPRCVLKELHRIFATFFWSNKVTRRSKHWATGEKIYLPKLEGGLGFRTMFDISKAI
ncbi:hypothetical protein H5410_062137 [Solanum commersonii]|uniref:F-box domain-containing protein n=1 Tax=Solanum commersonii TaxID=4109 RepID=A0A9J5W9L0_SOLCO|nr:hypothetical protein H5410_062137 [Solanum commersonii]